MTNKGPISYEKIRLTKKEESQEKFWLSYILCLFTVFFILLLGSIAILFFF